jgi:hypothetical protein
MLRTRRARALIALALATGVLLLYPFKVTVTGIWMITALNSDGHPIAGCRVEQQWEWRAIGVSSSDVLVTDVSGHAIFPRRTVRASVAGRTWGAIATFSFHGTVSGRHVEFFACNEKNARTGLGIHQLGETMMYDYRVPTVWRDASMLK